MDAKAKNTTVVINNTGRHNTNQSTTSGSSSQQYLLMDPTIYHHTLTLTIWSAKRSPNWKRSCWGHFALRSQKMIYAIRIKLNTGLGDTLLTRVWAMNLMESKYHDILQSKEIIGDYQSVIIRIRATKSLLRMLLYTRVSLRVGSSSNFIWCYEMNSLTPRTPSDNNTYVPPCNRVFQEYNQSNHYFTL